MTIDAVLVPVQPGAKKANAVVGGSAASQGDAGQLFAAMLGQWLYALEGAQGQTLGEENPAIIPAGKEANSGIATLGREGINPFLWAQGFVQPGMDGQTTVSTGSELDVYKERIIKLLDELNGEILVPKQGTKEAEIPNLAQEVWSKLPALGLSLVESQNQEAGSSRVMDSVVVEGQRGNNPFETQFIGSLQAEQTQAGVAPEPGPQSNRGRDSLSNHDRESFSLGRPEGNGQGAFSPERYNAADLAGTVQEDNPYPLNSTKSIAKENSAQIPVDKDSSGMNVSAALAASVENNETDRRTQNGKPLTSNSLDKPVDATNQLQNLRVGAQGFGENQLSMGKDSGDSFKKQTESGKNTSDERVQNEIPNPKPQGRESTEIFFHIGSERAGTGENNSSLKPIGTEILNGTKGFSPIWDRIAEAVREHRNSPEVKELQLQLHPAELGKIKVLLNWQDGQVNLQVHASESATGAILQHNLSDLRQVLEQAGVSCGLLESGFGGGDRQQREQEFSAPTYTSREEEEQVKVFLPEQAYGSGNVGGRINYMA